ncbi:hypothetical protein [Kitasatospora sp. NPDC057223]|uniref:hypothetical protein n=1 Tax=Kitasatospora sp. NPDC057223 TaxID=3346055 RepID=UPI00363C7784
MTEIAGQLIPVASALAGVTLTLLSNAWLERSKWRRLRTSERDDRTLASFTDLLQTTTDIARTLRQTAEQLDSGQQVNVQAVGITIDELIGQVRRQGTAARLVGPRSTFDLITTLERQVAQIHAAITSAGQSADGTALVEPARQLMRTRDNIIDHLRSIEGLP